MRTPRVVGENGLDHVTMEAQNLLRLQAGQTPLAGGQNPLIHASDFSGVTPRQSVAATPNALLAMTPRGSETPALNGAGRFSPSLCFICLLVCSFICEKELG